MDERLVQFTLRPLMDGETTVFYTADRPCRIVGIRWIDVDYTVHEDHIEVRGPDGSLLARKDWGMNIRPGNVIAISVKTGPVISRGPIVTMEYV